MAKTTNGKKKRTAAALAGTLSAFAKEEVLPLSPPAAESIPSEKTSTPDQLAEAKPEETSATPEAFEPKRESPEREAPTPPHANEESAFEELKTRVSHIIRRGQLEISLECSGEALRSRIETWLEGISRLEDNRMSRRRAELTRWFAACLEGLSEPEFQTFCQRWARYCAGLGFELWWLLDNKLKNSPLRPNLEGLALDYIEHYRQAEEIRADIDLFKTYLTWQQDPARSAEYESLNQTLFIRLSHQGLISPPPVEIYLDSAETREAYVRQALLNAAEQDTATFLVALAETM